MGYPCSFATAVGDWARLVRDLTLICRPVLTVLVPIVVLAVAVSRGIITTPL
jgi:hypothetical protein